MKHLSRKDILIITLIIGITFSYYLLAFTNKGIDTLNSYFSDFATFGFAVFAAILFMATSSFAI